MPNNLRYNRAIELLEQDKPVFCSGLVWNGNLDDLTFIADSDYDMVIIEMEHQGFSFNDSEVPMRLEQGFRIIITSPERFTGGLEEGRRLSGR